VVGGQFSGSLNLFGSAYLPAGSTTNQINENAAGCAVYTNRGTGGIDFNEINSDVLAASSALSNYAPTLYLDANNKLTRIANPSGAYDVITFNTCTNGCTSSTGLSVSKAIFEAIGNWNGATGMTWPTKLIINVRQYLFFFFT
jgi:hypothetical protein